MLKTSIDLDGASVEATWFGPKPSEAPTIVMMHEGLGSVSTWRDFPGRLAESTGCGAFVFSRLGYGRSSEAKLPRPLDYFRREAVEVLPRLLDKIEFRRGILLGHSDGGSIAAMYAGSIQDHRVRGLVLIEPHFFVEEINLNAIRRLNADYAQTDFRTRLSRHHDDVDKTFRGWADMWLDPGFKSFNMTEELQHIRVPLLIVKGADDPYGTAAQIRMAKEQCYCPVESFVLPNARHAPHHEQPEQTLEIIGSFINHILWSHGEARPHTLESRIA